MTRWEVTKAVRASKLSAPSKLVMLALADIADVGTAEIPERFTPSLTVLGQETSLGRSTVARCLRELERDGWVIRTRPLTVDALGQYERTRYQLQVPPDVAETLVPERDQSQSGTSPSATASDPSAGTGPPSAAAGHRVRSSSDQPLISSSDHPPTAKRPRGTRIPDDFEATPEMIAWARENAPMAGSRDHDAFVDYWRGKPGQQGVKTDWPATWRNWMRRTQTDREGGRNGRATHSSYRNPADVSAYEGEL